MNLYTLSRKEPKSQDWKFTDNLGRVDISIDVDIEQAQKARRLGSWLESQVGFFRSRSEEGLAVMELDQQATRAE